MRAFSSGFLKLEELYIGDDDVADIAGMQAFADATTLPSLKTVHVYDSSKELKEACEERGITMKLYNNEEDGVEDEEDGVEDEEDGVEEE